MGFHGIQITVSSNSAWLRKDESVVFSLFSEHYVTNETLRPLVYFFTTYEQVTVFKVEARCLVCGMSVSLECNKHFNNRVPRTPQDLAWDIYDLVQTQLEHKRSRDIPLLN